MALSKDERDHNRRALYYRQLDGLYVRYRITERDFLTYVLPHIPEKSMFDIETAEREIRRFKQGLL